jgi:hypothetical protein
LFVGFSLFVFAEGGASGGDVVTAKAVVTKAGRTTSKSAKKPAGESDTGKKGRGGIGTAEAKILEAMFEKLDWDVTDVPEDEIVMMSGYSRSDSRGYRDGKKSLLSKGKIVKVAGAGRSYRLTAEGLLDRPGGGARRNERTVQTPDERGPSGAASPTFAEQGEGPRTEIPRHLYRFERRGWPLHRRAVACVGVPTGRQPRIP